MAFLRITTLIAFALLLFVGGLIGYLKSTSLISLFTGILSSILLFISIWASYRSLPWGRPLTLILVILLTLFFGYRFILTGHWMPGGMMCIAGIVTLLCQLSCPCPCAQSSKE